MEKDKVSTSPQCVSVAKDLVWRRSGKAYVLFHALVSLCTCIFGLEYLIAHWIPTPLGTVAHVIAMVGFLPFVLLSPVVCFAMIFILSRQHREWLYLGVCDIAVLILQVISFTVASH
jgi:hypothetical protein